MPPTPELQLPKPYCFLVGSIPGAQWPGERRGQAAGPRLLSEPSLPPGATRPASIGPASASCSAPPGQKLRLPAPAFWRSRLLQVPLWGLRSPKPAPTQWMNSSLFSHDFVVGMAAVFLPLCCQWIKTDMFFFSLLIAFWKRIWFCNVQAVTSQDRSRFCGAWSLCSLAGWSWRKSILLWQIS